MTHPSTTRSNPFSRSGLVIALLLPVFWLGLPGNLCAQGEYEATAYGYIDFSTFRQIPVAFGDTVTTFDYRGQFIPKDSNWPPTVVVCTEIWYRSGGVWTLNTMKGICFHTDADGDYYRTLYWPASKELDTPADAWDQRSVLTCDGGTGKYTNVGCELEAHSKGLGSGWWRLTAKGTFGVK